MSLPFQLTKHSIFDSRRTPLSKDSELCSSLLISSPIIPSLRSKSREKCARFLVAKDMNAQSQPQLVTKLTINEDYSNDKKNNTDSGDPFPNHQFAFKLIKKTFSKSRDSGLRKNHVRGLQTLENLALARRLRQSIEEQQDSKTQTNQNQKENDYSFFQSIDKKRPVTKHHFRIKSPDYGTHFDDKKSQTTTNIMRNSTMESFYSPKGSRIEVKAPVERESTILSVKRLVDTEFKDIEGSDVQTTKQKRLNAAQNKMSKLMLRISSAAPSTCKNIQSNVQSIGSVESLNLKDDILKMQSSVKNQDTSVHLKRAMTPSANTKSRLVLKNRPDTSLDRLANKRVKSSYRVKQAERSSKDSISCGRETTDQTPSVTNQITSSSRIFVNEGMDKKTCVSSSIQEIPSLNTSLHVKNKTKRTTREMSKQFEILSESENSKNDQASIEEFVKDEVIEGDQDNLETEDKVEIDEEAREREFRARLLGPDTRQKEDPNAHYKVAIQQKNVLRASSAKQDYFKHKIPEECLQAKAEINQLAKKVTNIQQEREISKSISKRSMDFVSGNSCTLNELEVGFVKEEYAKKAQGNRSIDYDEIDNLVSRLKYFSRLPRDVRMGLLRNGSYAYYSCGSTIFNQGDYGDQMYVILRGSVNVRVTKKASFGMLENTIVDTLYDGMHFGEYTITAVPPQDNKKDGIKESIKSKNLNRLKTFGFGEQSVGLEEINRTQEVSFSYQKDLSLKEIKTQEALTLSQRSYEDNKPRRMATVEAAESCDILCIPRDKFQDVFLNLVQKELDDKVRALSELSFFKKVDPVDLVPLANNLTMRVYKMDEVIQAVDQPVEKFRIIAKGRCQLVVGVTKKSEVPLGKTLANRVASAKRFNTGLSDYTNKETQIRTDTIQCFGLKHEIAPVQKVSNRAFTFEQVGKEGDQIMYVEHVPFATLTRGNFIGSRALLTENDFNNEHAYFQARFRLNKPAKVSMVADTPLVEVLEIEKHHLKYIPESLLKILKQGLMAAKEFDNFNIEREIKQNQEWDDYKAAQIAQIMKSKTSTFRTGFKVC